MYMVFKENRPQGNKKYGSYEQARQVARKWCRKMSDYQSYSGSNPSIGEYGYSVVKVN